MEKAIIVGAGPCGLSTAIELKKRGMDALIIEKGAIVNTIYANTIFIENGRFHGGLIAEKIRSNA